MLEEWKILLKKPQLWVTMIGLALIPALYNIIFLSSMWDPYGKVNQLPVAVVNSDKPAHYQGKTLSIGQDMVNNMAKNKALDYHFVNHKKAMEGLKKGSYYMVVNLPETLSEDASSLMTENPKPLEISYQTSKGHSFVASKMADSAMTKLKDSVSKNITYTYTNSLFQNMDNLKNGVHEAYNGSEKISNGANRLTDGGNQLSTNLNKLADSTVLFSDGTTRFSVGLGQYVSGVSQLANGTDTLATGLGQYVSGVNQLATGIDTLDQKSGQISGGIDQFSQANASAGQLASGADQLKNGLEMLTNQAGLSDDQQAQLAQLSQGLEQLNQAIQGSDPSGGLQDISTLLTTMATNAQLIVNSSLQNNDDVLSRLMSTQTYQSLTSEQQVELSSVIGTSPTSNNTEAATVILSSLETLQNGLSEMSSASQNRLQQLKESANIVLPAAATSLTNLSQGLTEVQSALNGKVLPASQQLSTGLNQFESKLGQGVEQLQSGFSQYASGVSELSSGASRLSNASNDLISGVTKLQSGASTLDSKSNELLNGSNQLVQSSGQLSSGAKQLAEGSHTLTSGLTDMSGGVSRLATGLKKADNRLSKADFADENAKLVSNPVKLRHQDEDDVKTNGVGMAPYMMSVALMVAAISSNMIFAKTPSGKTPKNTVDWLMRKASINGVIAVLSGIILYFAVHLIGLSANDEGKTLLLTVLASVTFTAMVTALYTWHERLGAFISLLLMLLQLASCAGTYPLALTDRFFQVINPFLPMSYSVLGLRQTISMSGNASSEFLTLTSFLIGFVVIGAMIYNGRMKKYS